MSDTIAVPASVVELPDMAPGRTEPGDLNGELPATDTWTDDMIARAGIPIVDVNFVTVGGGTGSFVMVDSLRIAEVPSEGIKVLTNIHVPWRTYEDLTRVSQIPRPERLRSDSQGMPDCLWGLPSYALRESRKEETLAPIWSVITEPIFVDYWTRRAGTVSGGLEKETNRLGYQQMQALDQARMVRKRAGGGCFTILACIVCRSIGPDTEGVATKYATFIVHIVTTWIVMCLFVLGPTEINLIRWRFNGARIFW